jgi:hypothetical protein
MDGEQIAGVVRALVAAVGGYFVGMGMIDTNTVVAVAGALGTIAAAVWSVLSKQKKNA